MSDAELRAMVRDVLREALAGRAGGAGQAARKPATAAPARSATETVAIASDADLAGFVRRLVALMDNPASAAALRSGQLKFTLAASHKPAAQAATPAAVAPAGASVVLDGTVTEAKINKCAGAGSVMLAPDAVITPLARDRARALGLKIERKR
ncbi:MAG: hypothetical protein H6878_09790 [Rhodobiaceae bacterium]|nr:hypothetical protein [Rhodobiaceae bacterium]MCC0016551.1 hypothetical protein [Rhodobiaceae bacterium]MCC0042385.1 hypothetical protein [Rhodobiaceae bacterium]